LKGEFWSIGLQMVEFNLISLPQKWSLPSFQNGRAKWAGKMGGQNGRAKWAGKMGGQNGRAKWAGLMIEGE
jgi:hypothetical protein